VALNRREVGWLLERLAGGRESSVDASLAAARIGSASRSHRRRLTLTAAQAHAVLGALDRGEQQGHLTRGLHALQLALRGGITPADPGGSVPGTSHS
jgi:hypothetical protein